MRHHFVDGLKALRFLKAKALSGGDLVQAIGYAESMRSWGDDRREIVAHLKAAVSGVTASDLDGPTDLAADLLAAVRPLSVVLRLPLRRVPPLIPMLTATGTTGHFVGESKAVPMSVGTFNRDAGLKPRRVAALTVATLEALQDPSLAGERALLADLAAACAEALDRAFLDRTNAGTADLPAGVAYNVTPITASTDLDADLAQAVRQLVDAGSNLSAAYWCLSSTLATRLSLLRGSSGAPLYPGLGALGGQIAGLPALTSQAAVGAEAFSDAASDITLVDAGQVAYVDAPAELRTSQEAMLEMSTTPAGAGDTPTASSASIVSMFQADCIALLATIRANWLPRRAGVAQVIAGVSEV